jgi:hypothetical protein
MTISTKKVSRASQWTESTWLEISNHVAETFGLSARRSAALRSKQIAQLIAAIPFLAGCDQPRKLAVKNLSHYVVSCGVGGQVYAATPDNSRDLFGRLAPAEYVGGDQRIVLRGMSLIALNMLADYKRDLELDRSIGKYNPVGDGSWDYEQKRAELTANIDAVDCPDMDKLVDAHTIQNVFWNFDAFPDWF